MSTRTDYTYKFENIFIRIPGDSDLTFINMLAKNCFVWLDQQIDGDMVGVSSNVWTFESVWNLTETFYKTSFKLSFRLTKCNHFFYWFHDIYADPM